MAGFQKATKSQSLLRAALYGPSGAGKTYSALRIATGLAGDTGKIGVIDTERGSASKYADRFDFDVLYLESATVENMVNAIGMAKDGGYNVLIIDSLSHSWQELLEEIDKLKATKYKGNSWSAWSEGTPKHRKLVGTILNYPGHVIATMRARTEWSEERDERGKVRPVKLGLAPEQGKGIEYEFDLLMSITTEHMGAVEKDRSGKFQDLIIEKPGEEFGQQLRDWLSDGERKPMSELVKDEVPEATPAERKPARPTWFDYFTKRQKEGAVGKSDIAAVLGVDELKGNHVQDFIDRQLDEGNAFDEETAIDLLIEKAVLHSAGAPNPFGEDDEEEEAA